MKLTKSEEEELNDYFVSSKPFLIGWLIIIVISLLTLNKYVDGSNGWETLGALFISLIISTMSTIIIYIIVYFLFKPFRIKYLEMKQNNKL